MKLIRIYLLGIYDILLSIGAIYTGVMMVLGKGIFSEYPKEWLSKIPFEGWTGIGMIGIVIFGLGNCIAAILSLSKKGSKPWLMSGLMGIIFLVSIIIQRIMLGEWYLATGQFLIFSIIQIFLSGYGLLGYRQLLEKS